MTTESERKAWLAGKAAAIQAVKDWAEERQEDVRLGGTAHPETGERIQIFKDQYLKDMADGAINAAMVVERDLMHPDDEPGPSQEAMADLIDEALNTPIDPAKLVSHWDATWFIDNDKDKK
jgi:hypothetical protein